MKKKSASKSAFFNPRVLVSLALCLASVFLAVLSFGRFSAQAQTTDPLVPPLFDCSRIHELGIDQQENLRAGAIMIFCGQAEGGAASAAAQASAAMYGGNDVDLVTGPETWPNVTQSETFTAGNPDNPLQIVAAYNDSRGRFATPVTISGASVSTDGGNTFTRLTTSTGQSPFPNTYGDPVVLYNRPTHTWYTVWLDGLCGAQGLGGYFSATPSDPNSWIHYCVHSGSSDDRESGWADNNPSSPFYGRMYVSWNDFARGQGIFVRYSTDNGHTWTNERQLTSTFYRNVQITGDLVTGDVYVAAMNEMGGGLGNRANLLFKSSDGGNTWTQTYTGPTFAGPGRGSCGYFATMYNNPAYWRHMGWGEPAALNGVVHYVYAARDTTTGDPGNVFYIRSTDGGVTFSAPFMLNSNTDPTKAQWEPNISVAADGTLFAVWYDEREGGNCQPSNPNNQCYRMWARKSLDNGATWLADKPFSDVVSPLPVQPDPGIVGCYVGDYDYASQSRNQHLHTWTDGRVVINGSSQQDAFFDSEPGPALSVVSRKHHGSAGNFDINLPLSGTRGVECRTTGSLPDSTSGDYELIFTFPNPVLAVANASVNCGSVSSSFVGPGLNQYTVILSGDSACNQQYVTVTLTGVVDNQGNTLASASATMGLLFGDTNADGRVNVGDINQTQSQTRHAVTTSNFREDVDANGVIDGNDVSFVASKSGTALPTPP